MYLNMRERHKSAPYLWLKNSKGLESVKNSKYQTRKKSIKLTREPNDENGALKGGSFRIFYIHCCITSQKRRGHFGEKSIFRTNSHNAEKTESGTL